MYALSTEAKKDLQSYTLSGTIGDVAIDDENILKGSLKATNQCADKSTFGLGGAYISALSCSFIGVNIGRNDWKNLPITLSVTINGTETFPIHTWYVDKAEHTKGITAVKAYDAMAKFDKSAGVDKGAYGTMYEWLMLACTQCNVTFGMTEQEVEALPNGNTSYFLEEMGDIETWRDIIFWLSVKVVGFATIDRSGNLILCTYHSTVDDTLDANIRYNTSRYSDEVITYSGVSVYITADQKVYYYHNEPDDGYTLKLGNDPFMQVTKAQREDYIDNILANIGNIEYNSCEVTIPFGLQYDLGDVLQFPNGQGSATDKFCIMEYSWTYYGGFKIKSISGQKASMSKTDKNLQGLLSSVGQNEFTSYELRNVAPISIGEDENVRLLLAKIASNTQTKAQIHVEVNLESEAIEDYTQGIVTYLIDSTDTEFYPTETWIDGKHVLHLMYILPLQANDMQQFEVYMQSVGGSIEIPRGGVWLYASGAGLVGDGKWDGNITLLDYTEEWAYSEYTFEDASDSVSFEEEQETRITSDGSTRITSDGSTRVI